MVLESVHRGRTVPCPHCHAANEVPDRLDFEEIHLETLKDADRGGWLLPLAIASTCLGCLPLAAWIWWYAAGLVHRARDVDREIDPTIVWARWVALAGTVLLGLGLAAIGVAALLNA